MKNGMFYSQIEEINKILSKYKLSKNYLRKNSFSHYSRKVLKTTDYGELHSEMLNNRDFTFQLFDDSLLQFARDEVNGELILGYCYIPFPLQYITYEEFLLINGFDYNDAKDELVEEYEQSMSEALPKKNILTIRYDYSLKEYSEKIHSVSHIHVGFTKIKLSSAIIMTPIAFLLFLLKQLYYDDWKVLIKDAYFLNHFNTCKNKCSKVPKKYFSENDKNELHLI